MDQNITILLTGSFTLLLPVDHHAKGHITQWYQYQWNKHSYKSIKTNSLVELLEEDKDI